MANVDARMENTILTQVLLSYDPANVITNVGHVLVRTTISDYLASMADISMKI